MLLKLKDIREWLIENRKKYQQLKAQEFPPLNNEVYWMYDRLYEFIEFFQFSQICHEALQELKLHLDCKFSDIVEWTLTYEVLGSQQLLMFEINYINWDEEVNEEFLKIHEGLYTERRPFADIICFCEVFQLLYWNNSIYDTELTENDKLGIVSELKTILKTL